MKHTQRHPQHGRAGRTLKPWAQAWGPVVQHWPRKLLARERLRGVRPE